MWCTCANKMNSIRSSQHIEINNTCPQIVPATSVALKLILYLRIQLEEICYVHAIGWEVQVRMHTYLKQASIAVETEHM